MASHRKNMVSTDLAADSGSLSFAGLLSIQDLQLKKLPTKKDVNFKLQEKEFEFNSTKPDSRSSDSSKNRSVDMSISNGQLQLQALLYQTKPYQVAPKSVGATNKPENGTKVANKSEHTSSKLSFVQKLARIVAPCRECHAETPSVKARSIAQEPVKLR